MDVLAQAASLLESSKVLMIAFFTFKGGVGKTTLSSHVGTMLARLGYNVLFIDADRQRNLTTWFQESIEDKAATGSDEDGEPDEDGEEEEEGEAQDNGAEQMRQQLEEMLKQQRSGRRTPLPDIVGDKLSDGTRPITSDYLIPQAATGDTLYSALSNYISSDKPRDVHVRQVQTADYNGTKGRGKIFLLQGANSEEMGKLQHEFDGKGSTRFKTHSAFRRLALKIANEHNVRFVLVDMGPSTDDINRTFATSCDIIQPCANPDSFSWSAVTSMVTEVLPEWLEWWQTHRRGEKRENAAAAHRYVSSFPRIMPIMALKYAWDPRKKTVRWADSNFMQAITDAMNEIRSMLDEEEDPEAKGAAEQDDSDEEGGEEEEEEEEAEEEEQEAVKRMEDCWRGLLRGKLRQEGYKQRLKVLLECQFIWTKGEQVIVPLMKQFQHMAACHEMGRCMFDISVKDLTDYYFEPGSTLSKKDHAWTRALFQSLKKEAASMEANLKKLALAYVGLLIQVPDPKGKKAATPASKQARQAGGSGRNTGTSKAAVAGTSRAQEGSGRAQERKRPAPSDPADKPRSSRARQ